MASDSEQNNKERFVAGRHWNGLVERYVAGYMPRQLDCAVTRGHDIVTALQRAVRGKNDRI